MREGGETAAAAALAAEIRRRLGPPPELPEWPLVSIVVLNRDGAPLLRRLLEELVECTDYPALELVLVDNASNDDSLDFIRAVEVPFPISILANAHNESFADGCNAGAALASGELLLFLNNDAEPFEPGWLRELVAALRGGDHVAVGPTLLEPARSGGYLVHQRGQRAREEGGVLLPDPRDRGADPLGGGLGEDVETITVVAACLLVERAAFERVGGFTRGYWYGGEDSDLGLKLREAGMNARCSGRSFLIHAPNATLGAVAAERRAEWMRGNARFFAERWGPRARREYELDRLDGGGLWSEPVAGGGGAAPSRAELEALGFCLEAAGDAAGLPWLEQLRDAVRERGHRCLLRRGADVDDLGGMEYDVAVHFRGSLRYVPRPRRLNVLWRLDGALVPSLERARYDLVAEGEPEGGPGGVERLAEQLLADVAATAEKRRYRRRIEPAHREQR